MNRGLLLIFFLGVLLCSCVLRKKTIYLQKKGPVSEEVVEHAKFKYKVRPNDILHIVITSLNPQTSDFFNLKSEGEKQSLKGYSVNKTGYIYMPVLDSIKVGGLTIPEIQTNIQKSVREHVTDATVIVKLANFNITVLGEVANPGLVSFDGDELTIIQAIGLAKDITDFGNKKKVKLIRKEGDSSRFVTLDLTSMDIVASEYYYLQPDDVIYVEPLRAKNYKLNASQVALFVGVVTFFFLLLNVVKK